MQEFFMDYGLWLLIALLVIIGLVFLLSGKRKSTVDPAAEPAIAAEAEPFVAATPPPVVNPVAVPPAPVPVEAAPEPVAKPAPVVAAAEPVPASPAITTPAPTADADDLLRLKGVGPKLKALLIDLGVTRFAQIAAWSDADIAAVDAKLGNFKGRPVRDQWVDQAKYLAAGDVAGFEAKYGKL
jgi:predicted flap endonuclease-1-like 5' DNA nuclease